MRRTGSAAILSLTLLFATQALAADNFHQQVDRDEVGTEDTFTLTVVWEDPPADGMIIPPKSPDFEILASHQSTQYSYSFGSGGSQVKRVLTQILTMRANREGKLTIPPSTGRSGGNNFKTDSIIITAKKGTLAKPRQNPRMVDPFTGMPLDDFFGGGMGGDPVIPKTDSDLFVRATLSDDEVYVGQQVTYSIHIYSRVDLASVEQQLIPKLDGFWSENLDAPTQLASETREVNGVPYRVYLLHRRALFPMKTGTIKIDPASVVIATGFFDVRKYSRSTNSLNLKVKPLPPGGPPNMTVANVGNWRLFTEVSNTTVDLGTPVTVKVILEGRGNLKNVTPPKLTGPRGVKVYDPTTSDKMQVSRGKVAGRRVHEYLVLPQQTGTFKLSGLEFPYFDPETGKYDVSRTDEIVLNVRPSGAGGAAGVDTTASDDSARNVLSAGGIRPPRATSQLELPKKSLWRRPWFMPLAVAPIGLFSLALLFSAIRARSNIVDEGALKKQKVKEARKRLAAAEKLKAAKPDAFYGEVEKALLSFLEGKLGYPVQGLTRDQLVAKLKTSQIADPHIQSVVAVLDACDLGRFAPGAAGSSTREQVLDQAEAAMEGFTA